MARVGVERFFGVRFGLPAPKLFKCSSVSGRTHVDYNASTGLQRAVGELFQINCSLILNQGKCH